MSQTAVSPSATHLLEWLAISLTLGLGPTKSRKLVERFGSPESVLRASLTELEGAGIQAVSAQSLATGKSAELAREEIARAAAAGVNLVTMDDPSYPPCLKEIYDPPLILYVRGSVEILTKPGIAMVGTRHPTPYGSGMAERLACDLAAQGLVIISGMARGVDTASHRGALSAKGKTLAVFGTGVDVIYSKENSRLSEQILALGGALISEFPVGTFAANSWGPNTLIKPGAKLVATWDVWEDLPTEVRLTWTPSSSPESQGSSSASLFPDEGLPPHEKRILGLLKADEATHIDEIVEKLETEMSSSEIFAVLFERELTGKVRQMPGKNFVKSFWK